MSGSEREGLVAAVCVPFNSQGETTDAEGSPPRSLPFFNNKSQLDKHVRLKWNDPLPLISLKLSLTPLVHAGPTSPLQTHTQTPLFHTADHVLLPATRSQTANVDPGRDGVATPRLYGG